MTGHPLTLPALVERHLPGRAAEPAVVEGARVVTWAELDLLGRRTAAWLRAAGIRRGDRVAVWLPNGVAWLAQLLGLARLGATLVAVNTRFRASELEHILGGSAARALVLQPDFRGIDFRAVLREVRAEALRGLDLVAVVGAERGAPAPIEGKATLPFDAFASGAAEAATEAEPDAPAALFTTSGTTRAPKLVLHSQRTLAAHVLQVARAHGLADEGARLLAALPLCGVFGLDSALAAIAGGARVVMMDTFEPATAAALIRRHAITHLYGSDELLRRIADTAPGLDPFPSIRLLGMGAFNPGAAEFARAAWERRLPIFGMYGSSEVQALFSLQPASLPVEQRIEGGGLPSSPGAEVRVRDVESGALLPPGVDGELEIRAPTNFVGYLGDPAATAEAVRGDGFFRTGDVGHLRGDGTFVFRARRGDALRIAGYLVSPAEVEDALRRIPGVAEAQVVGVPIDGQLRPCAFVIPAPGAAPTEAEVAAAARQLMAGFKVPARVWFLDGFPTTDGVNGVKVQRARLRAMALERLARS